MNSHINNTDSHVVDINIPKHDDHPHDIEAGVAIVKQ